VGENENLARPSRPCWMKVAGIPKCGAKFSLWFAVPARFDHPD